MPTTDAENTEPEELFSYLDDDVSVTVAREPDGRYLLTWNDGVVNEWSEWYTDLSIAVLRFAVLVACGERGWRVGFAGGPDSFTAPAKEFIAAQTTGDDRT